MIPKPSGRWLQNTRSKSRSRTGLSCWSILPPPEMVAVILQIMHNENMSIDLRDMDYVRAAIANAIIEDMDAVDLYRCAEHAQTPQDFDEAVNLLAQTQEQADFETVCEFQQVVLLWPKSDEA